MAAVSGSSAGVRTAGQAPERSRIKGFPGIAVAQRKLRAKAEWSVPAYWCSVGGRNAVLPIETRRLAENEWREGRKAMTSEVACDGLGLARVDGGLHSRRGVASREGLGRWRWSPLRSGTGGRAWPGSTVRTDRAGESANDSASQRQRWAERGSDRTCRWRRQTGHENALCEARSAAQGVCEDRLAGGLLFVGEENGLAWQDREIVANRLPGLGGCFDRLTLHHRGGKELEFPS